MILLDPDPDNFIRIRIQGNDTNSTDPDLQYWLCACYGKYRATWLCVGQLQHYMVVRVLTTALLG